LKRVLSTKFDPDPEGDIILFLFSLMYAIALYSLGSTIFYTAIIFWVSPLGRMLVKEF
jgi:hypothetical protein